MKASLIALWVLNIFDLLATWYGVHITGYAVEMNPFMAWAMGHGLAVFALVKFSMFAAATAMLVHVHRRRPRRAVVVTWVLTSLYGLVAFDHIFGYLFMRNL